MDGQTDRIAISTSRVNVLTRDKKYTSKIKMYAYQLCRVDLAYIEMQYMEIRIRPNKNIDCP